MKSLDPCPLLYASSGRFVGGWTRERGSIERDPSCHASWVHRAFSHARDRRPQTHPSSQTPAACIRPSMSGGFPPGLRRIPGANLAQEFLAQILRKNSWRKFCARIPGANFAQEFLAQILRKNSQRGVGNPSQDKGGGNRGKTPITPCFPNRGGGRQNFGRHFPCRAGTGLHIPLFNVVDHTSVQAHSVCWSAAPGR